MTGFDSQIFDDDPSIKPTKEVNPADIRFAAMNLLARREHSLRELKQKLKRRFPDEDLIDCELQRLARENLQSDERFAESFVRQRANRGYGLNRVRQEMREKGLADSEISLALERVDIDWLATALEVYCKKFGEESPADLKEKARRIRFMEYRGFGRDYYQHLLNS